MVACQAGNQAVRILAGGGQIGKTAGWMGGTLASMVVTGLLPNPITAIAAVACGGFCIRSIAKSRTAAKELGAQVPLLKQTARSAAQIAGDAGLCGPLVGAWGNLLAKPQDDSKAA